MLKFLTITTLCFCSFLLLATEKSAAVDIPFAVDDYIPVLFEDAELQVGGSFGFQGSSSSFENDSAGGSFSLFERSRNDNDRFDLNSDGFYRKRYITVSKWYTFSTNFNARFSKSTSTFKSESESFSSTSSQKSEIKNTSKNINPQISQSIDIGKYVSGDYMVSLIAGLSYSYRENTSNENTRFRQFTNIVGNTATRNSFFDKFSNPDDRKSLNLSGDLLFGRGRIYDGVFAFTAISMIEELDSKNLLLKTPTENEMRELTEVIYQNRLKHAIDFRIRAIESLDAIISYLQSNGIIESTSSVSTPVINDVWNFFPRSSHYFGMKVRAGFGIRHDISSGQGTNESTNRNLVETYDINNPTVITTVSDNTLENHTSFHNKDINTTPYFTLLIEKNKPIDNRLQLELRAQAWIYFSTKDTSENTRLNYVGDSLASSFSSHSSNEYDSFTRFVLSGNLRYFFDNRTSASVSASYDRADFDQTLIKTEFSNGVITISDTLSTERGGYNSRVAGNLSYRITIPTTISASVRYSNEQ